MTTLISALSRTARSFRRAINRIANRLTRKAKIKLGLTLSFPPFVKFALDYTADLSKPENRLPQPANDNKPRRSRKRTA